MAAIVPGYIARFNRLLTRLTATRGEPLEGLAPELLSVLQVEGKGSDPRYAHLAEDRLAAGFSQLIASSGNVGQSILFNPVGSGVLLWVEQLIVQTAGIDVDLFLSGPNFSLAGWNGPLTTIGFRDGRSQTPSSLPVAQIYNQNAAAQIGGRRIRIPATFGAPVPVDFIVPPGYAFGCSDDVNNVANIHSYFWRERAVESTELGT